MQCLFDAEAMGYLQVAKDVVRLCEVLDLDHDETFFFDRAERLYHNKAEANHVDCAIIYYTKAAQMGHAPSQDMLGYIFKNEEYNRNYDKSYEWSLKAAKQGNASSQYRVGLYIEKGLYGTVKENTAEAIRWYENAAAQGNADAKKAVARLKSVASAKPTVAFKSNAETLKSTVAPKPTVAPKQTTAPKPTVNSVAGNTASRPAPKKAEPVLSAQQWYDKGIKFSQDSNLVEAYKCFAKAAEMGHTGGMCAVAFRLQFGKGVAADYKAAFEWYKKAADCGDEKGEINLAHCYMLGIGVKHDFAKAKALYEKHKLEYDLYKCRKLEDDFSVIGIDEEFYNLPKYNDGYVICPNISINGLIKILNHNSFNKRYYLKLIEPDGDKYYKVYLDVKYVGNLNFTTAYADKKYSKYENKLEEAASADYRDKCADLVVGFDDFKYGSQDYNRAMNKISDGKSSSARSNFIESALIDLRGTRCCYHIIATKNGKSLRVGTYSLHCLSK